MANPPSSGPASPPRSPPSAAKSPPKSSSSSAKSPPSSVQTATQKSITASDPTILPASHWQQTAIPAVNEDDDADDGDSVFGSTGSSTDSLAESVLEYRTIQGRTFHSYGGKAAEAWIPNDSAHLESMDLFHHLMTLVLGGKLHLAPLGEHVHKALDIGTGTGIWAIDFADQYPGAEVIGTDLSPIQPTWVPPNCRFEIHDANESRWFWPDNTFDYIHKRLLVGSIVDWNGLFKETFRVLKPGGWMESYECSSFVSDDGSLKEESPMGQWSKVFWEGGEKFGRTFRVVEEDLQRKGMEAAGFVDITVRNFKCPIGRWPKDPDQKTIGTYARETLETDIEGYVLYMWGQVMGWSREEMQIFIAHLRNQLRDHRVHGYYKHRVVYGRKPE